MNLQVGLRVYEEVANIAGRRTGGILGLRFHGCGFPRRKALSLLSLDAGFRIICGLFLRFPAEIHGAKSERERERERQRERERGRERERESERERERERERESERERERARESERERERAREREEREKRERERKETETERNTDTDSGSQAWTATKPDKAPIVLELW